MCSPRRPHQMSLTPARIQRPAWLPSAGSRRAESQGGERWLATQSRNISLTGTATVGAGLAQALRRAWATEKGRRRIAISTILVVAVVVIAVVASLFASLAGESQAYPGRVLGRRGGLHGLCRLRK